jgi:hypothetical protein
LELYKKATKERCLLDQREDIQAILKTQVKQCREGVSTCPNILVNTYMEIMEWCQKGALKLAEQDVIAARRYLIVSPICAKQIARQRKSQEEQQQQLLALKPL